MLCSAHAIKLEMLFETDAPLRKYTLSNIIHDEIKCKKLQCAKNNGIHWKLLKELCLQMLLGLDIFAGRHFKF